jgi:dipeptidyl aminopeptidase/acylaminoacyl peptidase
MLVHELVRNNVRVEFHLYPEGHHGLALANEITVSGFNSEASEMVHTWIEHSLRFIKRYL